MRKSEKNKLELKKKFPRREANRSVTKPEVIYVSLGN